MGPLGVQEMVGIFLIALLLFGPKKLPELGRMLGKGLREFRRMKNEMKTTFETHLQELDREARLSEVSNDRSLTSAPDYSSSSYHYPYEDSASHVPTYEAAAALEAGTEPAAVTHAAVETNTSHIEAVPGTVPRNGSLPTAFTTVHNGTAPVEEEHPA